MDELLHHCLRELSFDGDLGCNVNRLKDFIVGFYSNVKTPIGQSLDDAFCAFVWSLITQHPTVQVGLKPAGLTSEVWIAPQTSAKRKGKERAEQPSGLVPIPNAKGRLLADLIRQHGDDLRIAIDPDAIYAAITGTHIRSSKLSPMVYSALQTITRGRENGVSVVELGQQTRYDQKTCFYLVKQLTELDLVVKVRRGGVGTHFCIHKYFFERSPLWKAIREEENEAGGQHREEGTPVPDTSDEQEGASTCLGFTPIDARHLSSLPLIRARVIKLLQASKNNIHPSNNLIVTVGFANPTKTDRRFFQSRIRELLQQGIIEKVVVPSQKRKHNNAYVKCFRLVSEQNRPAEGDAIILPDVDEEKDEGGQEGVKVNLTLHKQVINLLEEAGVDGMTLYDISTALCDFDKRTVELLLGRAEKYPPPAHLRDLGVVCLMETSGRERRHRYYTTRSYHLLLTKENFESAPDVATSNDLDSVGGFAELNSSSFYTEPGVLRNYQDGSKEKKRGGRPRKHAPKNPILPDGSVKRGRPRKRPIEEVKSDEKQAEKAEFATTLAEVELVRPEKRRRKDAQEPERMEQVSTTHERSGRKGKQSTSSYIAKSKKRPRPDDVSGAEKAETNVRKRIRPPRSETGSLLTGNVPVLSSSPDIVGGSTLQEGTELAASDMPERGTQEEPIQTSTDIVEGAATVGEVARPNDVVPIDPTLLAVQVKPSYAGKLYKPVKGSPSTSRSKVNVSHLRRENELYRVIVEQGGIVNIQSKEFHVAHHVLLEALSKAGEPTSSPVGTTIDKRTLTTTLESLERRGRVKQLKTSVPTHTGNSKPVCVVYLPDLPHEKLNGFLAELSRVQLPPLPSSSYLKIDQQVEFGADLPASQRTERSVLPLQLLQLEQPGDDSKKERWSKNVARVKQLFSYDDHTIRSVLLTERTTLAQYYGFIVGKIARARRLHLSTLKAFENHKQIPGIICHEHRVVDLAYYCHELPLELYLSFVSVLSYEEELKQILNTEDGRQKLVRDLPAQLHSSLQIGRSRARSRILETLDVLRLLDLVVPLQPSSSEHPSRCCTYNGSEVLEPATSNMPSNAFNCWQFRFEAPIHVWGLSEAYVPLWKQIPVVNDTEGQTYWSALYQACINSNSIPPVNSDSGKNLSEEYITLGRSLRRAASWASEYVFTWHQSQYMKQFVEVHTGKTPLQEEDEGVRASKISLVSWVTCAPEESVRHFYSTNHTKLVLELEKARNRAKQRRSEKKAEATTEARTLLARKAAEAKQQREGEWDKLLSRIHPSSLPTAAAVRVKRIRTRFMQTSRIQNQEKWEKEILAALHEADLVTKQFLRPSDNPDTVQFSPITSGTTLPLNGEKSVQLLIAQQGPAMRPKKSKGKDKDKGKGNQDISDLGRIELRNRHVDFTGTEEKRRHRFQWNHDYDELARDASAIIRARCRVLSRLDWGAFEQVFPSVPRNTVRQRLAHLREFPGNDGYINRLEEQWHGIWLQHRGTPGLPDEDPLSATNFDLAKHIEFLRSHIDKNALRVGFAQSHEKSNLTTLSSVDDLLSQFSVVESNLSAPLWDFMWNAAVEEGREKRLMRLAFTHNPVSVEMNLNLSSEMMNVAEAALKMTLGTPHERYDHEHASNLLRMVGDSMVESAKNNLLARGTLSKLVRDPQKQKPGRQLKISEMNQNAIGGTIPRDTFHEATALDELSRQDSGWREWPLTATDGDTAALIEAVSNNKINFKIDTSHARSARTLLDWNSKKADDDQIETAIFVQFDVPESELPSSPASPDELITGGRPPHSSLIDGIRRCCKGQALNGLIDCGTCLEEEWLSVVSTLDTDEERASRLIIDSVRDAGAGGLSKHQLRELKSSLHLTDIQLSSVIQRFTDAPVPILFWTGYDNIVLVHSTFLAEWTVVAFTDPMTRSYPRRWYDINGCRIQDYWQAALRAVIGVVIFRPGITQYEMRWRLRTVYDRQEVNDILQYLLDESYLSYRQQDASHFLIQPLDDEEEKQVFWFVGNKPWYQV